MKFGITRGSLDDEEPINYYPRCLEFGFQCILQERMY